MCVCVGGGRAQLYLSTFSVSETSSPLIWPKAKITKIFGHLIPYGIHHHKIWKTLFTLNTVWPILYMSAIKPAKSKDKQKLLTLHSLWNSSPQNSREAFYTSHHMSWTVLVCHKTNQKEKQNRNFDTPFLMESITTKYERSSSCFSLLSGIKQESVLIYCFVFCITLSGIKPAVLSAGTGALSCRGDWFSDTNDVSCFLLISVAVIRTQQDGQGLMGREGKKPGWCLKEKKT